MPFSVPLKVGFPHFVDIWRVMNDFGDVKGSCMDVQNVQLTIDPVVEGLIFRWYFGKVIDELVMVADGRIVSYNLGTQTFKYLPIHSVEPTFYQAVV